MSEEKRGGRQRRRVVRAAGPAGESVQPAAKIDAAAPVDEPIAAEAQTVKLESSESTAAVAADESATADSSNSGAELWTPKVVASESADAESDSPATDSEKLDGKSDEESGESGRRLGWIGWIAAAVAAVSALVLIGSGVFLVYHQHQVSALQERRAAYVQTAKQVVLNLTDISGDTAPQDIDRVLAVASGDLKVEYTQRKDAYAQVIQQAKVKATGEVIEAALENEDAHNAVVLVAAKQTLTNAGSPGPQQRYYRFRITVARDDSGQMTGSKVEFVA
jgi:Mce-associated membrane protein